MLRPSLTHSSKHIFKVNNREIEGKTKLYAMLPNSLALLLLAQRLLALLLLAQLRLAQLRLAQLRLAQLLLAQLHKGQVCRKKFCTRFLFLSITTIAGAYFFA